VKCMKITRLFRKKRNKKGVSPIIAVVLMVAVIVAISIIVYASTTEFVYEKTNARSVEFEQLILESQRLSGDTLTITVRNISNMDVVIDTMYINGYPLFSNVNFHMTRNGISTINITITDVCTHTQFFSEGIDIMLVTERGTQIKFTVRG
jgi:flagellin-like protein